MKWAFIWALFILILCAIPGRDLPSSSFLELINFDKVVHSSLFFVLSLLMIRGLKQQTRFKFPDREYKQTAVIICIAYGGVIELAQGHYFIERSADIYDFIANTLGCVTGLLLFDKTEKLVFSRHSL